MQVYRSVVVALLGCVAAACTTDISGTATTTTEPLPDAASLFDPCTDIPEEFLSTRGLKLDDSVPPLDETVNGVTWYGCGWTKRDHYFVTIATTTLTLDLIESRGFDEFEEFEIDDRRAVTYRRQPLLAENACVADVELGAGTLDISVGTSEDVTGPDAVKTCELARQLATELVDFLPQ